MNVAWKNAFLARWIRAYYVLNARPLRWLVRRLLPYRMRDKWVRFYLTWPRSTPDTGRLFQSRDSAALEGLTAAPLTQSGLGNRRVAVYSVASGDLPDTELIVCRPREQVELQQSPFWGQCKSEASRFILQLPRTVYRIDNAQVEGDCLGVFKENHFVSMLLAAPTPHVFTVYDRNDVVSWGRLSSFRLSRKASETRIAQAIFIDAAEGYGMNYFHVQVDVASSLVMVAEALTAEQISNTSVLLPDGLPDACEALLSMLAEGYGLKTMRLQRDTLVGAGSIYFSPYASRMPDSLALDAIDPFHVNRESVQAVRRALRRISPTPARSVDGRKRPIYLTRKSLGASGKRVALNSDVIAAWVDSVGGLVVSPEMLDLESQIKLMSGASVVLCDAGGAIANALFCPEGTPFLILTHAYAPPTLFKSYLQALGLPSGFVYGTPVQASNDDRAHQDFIISMSDLTSAYRYMTNQTKVENPDGWH